MKNISILIVLLAAFCNSIFASGRGKPSEEFINADICIYAATPSGILAAIAIKEEGYSVVIVEPSRWVGGILGAGLKPIQDCPNFDAVGGTTRELMKVLGTGENEGSHSEDDLRKMSNTMSPKQIRDDFLRILQHHHIQVIYNHRIRNCSKAKAHITQADFDYAPFDETGCPVAMPVTESDLKVKAKIYIDASYEGELMARSGVSYRTGRESTIDFDEKNAGICPPTNLTPLDPFIEEGNKQSGLLPLISDEFDQKTGGGDYYTQAYNFRFYVTNNPQFRAVFKVPEDYNPGEYELVGRYIDYLKKNSKDKELLFKQLGWIFPGWKNSGEYNYQRNSLFTMAPVGISHLYADGDYGLKAQIWKDHQTYLSGLQHFLSTDSRVPEEFRKQTSELGLDLRYHPETQGWPHQLYIRVTRRLVGNYTITAHDVYNESQIYDPIALAQYGIDTYPSRRIWFREGEKTYVGLEGNMFVGGSKGPTNVPYPISYRAITPKLSECSNLLVPVCFSATHQGYASARMEPVFMMCGESAGIAAVQAILENIAVQEINMQNYLEKLRNRKQRLRWQP